MKSKSYVLVSLLLIGLLTFMTACGEKNKDANNAASGNAGIQAKEKVKIGITQIVEHPSLDEARKGFIAALKDAGYVEGENLEIDFQNAQNDQNNAATIAQKFASDGKDLILAIATPSAQTAAQNIKDVPILFTAVTDPLGAGLVQSIEKPGMNVTGTTDLHPEAVSKLMEFISKNVKDVKAVGIMANEGEQNTLTNLKQAEDALVKLGIKVVKAPVSNSSEVKQAAESLIGKVQAIYVPSDNTIVSALNAVIGVANENKIPLFVAEKDSVKAGGVASYGFEYYDLGYTTGKMAVEILKDGKKPADMAVRIPETLDLALNMKAAADQGFEVTDAIKSEVKPENLFK
ncbi:ABC transporter substrate-binding protein [Paenibacillus marinisediminis]